MMTLTSTQRSLLETVPESEILESSRDSHPLTPDHIGNEHNQLLVRQLLDCMTQLEKSERKVRDLEERRDKDMRVIVSRLLLLEGKLVKDKKRIERVLQHKDTQIRGLESHVETLRHENHRLHQSLDCSDSAIGSLDYIPSVVMSTSLPLTEYESSKGRNLTDPDRKSVEGALHHQKCKRNNTDPGQRYQHTKHAADSTNTQLHNVLNEQPTEQGGKDVDIKERMTPEADHLSHNNSVDSSTMTSPLAKFEANSCETRETLSYLQDTREKRSYSNPDDPESAYQKTSDKMEFSDRDFIPVNSDSNQLQDSIDGAAEKAPAVPPRPAKMRKKSVSTPDFQTLLLNSIAAENSIAAKNSFSAKIESVSNGGSKTSVDHDNKPTSLRGTKTLSFYDNNNNNKSVGGQSLEESFSFNPGVVGQVYCHEVVYGHQHSQQKSCLPSGHSLTTTPSQSEVHRPPSQSELQRPPSESDFNRPPRPPKLLPYNNTRPAVTIHTDAQHHSLEQPIQPRVHLETNLDDFVIPVPSVRECPSQPYNIPANQLLSPSPSVSGRSSPSFDLPVRERPTSPFNNTNIERHRRTGLLKKPKLFLRSYSTPNEVEYEDTQSNQIPDTSTDHRGNINEIDQPSREQPVELYNLGVTLPQHLNTPTTTREGSHRKSSKPDGNSSLSSTNLMRTDKHTYNRIMFIYTAIAVLVLAVGVQVMIEPQFIWGDNPCTRGPAYWCINEETMKDCDMVL